MKYTLVTMMLALLALSCNNPEKPQTTGTAETMQASPSTQESAYTVEMVVNTKDYACGMPTSAGINDTCHYEGKAYGFCSKECKEEFLKAPAKYLAEAK
jgi:YHS domain-containing protein